MATIEQLSSALIKADAAGDTEGARTLASEIRKMQFQPAPIKQTASAMDQVAANPATQFIAGAIKPVLGGIQALASPWVDDKDSTIGKMLGGYNAMVKRGEERQSAAANVVGQGADILGGMAPFAKGGKYLGEGASIIKKIALGMGFGGLSGAITPVTGNNQAEQRLTNTGVGLGVGAVLPAGFHAGDKLLKFGKDIIDPISKTGRDGILRSNLINMLGPHRQSVIKALEDSGELVKGSHPTVGEALADVPEAKLLAAYQRAVSRTTGDLGKEKTSPAAQFAQRKAEQEAARLEAQVGIGKDKKTVEDAWAALKNKTDPMRIGALDSVNRSATKPKQPDTAPLSVNAARWQKMQGKNVDLPKVSEEAARWQGMQDEIYGKFSKGIQPVVLVNKINSIATAPGAAKITSRVMSSINEDIIAKTRPDGSIDANDLYTIRKEIGNIIKSQSKETENWDKRLTGGLQKQVQNAIDDSIEGSGGAGWKSYLKTYKKDVKKVRAMEFGQVLESKLVNPLGKETAQKYANAVQVAKTKGRTKDFTSDQMGVVESIVDDLSRTAKYKDMAKSVQEIGQDGIASQKQTIPQLLNTSATISNWFIKGLHGSADKKINDIAATLLLNPKKMAEFLKEVPPSERGKIVSMIMKNGKAASIVGTSNLIINGDR